MSVVSDARTNSRARAGATIFCSLGGTLVEGERDPRDIMDPIQKQWEEFRASFAAGLLHVWLLKDLDELAPDYARHLQRRLDEASDIAAINEWDDFPIPSIDPESMSYEWWDREGWELLQEQLFPKHSTNADRDFHFASRGLATIALHSALETFCKSVGAHKRGSLPASISEFLKQHGCSSLLDAQTSDALQELDATRHIFVHNRGIVDDRYIRAVAGSTLVTSDPKLLSNPDLQRFAGTAWTVATIIRQVLTRPEVR
jgi:hypothetical protein